MTNHPNRSRHSLSAARNPSPEEIRAARDRAGLTQEQAAALVYANRRAWQNWEAAVSAPENRAMHPGLYELFLIKAGQIPADAGSENGDR